MAGTIPRVTAPEVAASAAQVTPAPPGRLNVQSPIIHTNAALDAIERAAAALTTEEEGSTL
jgi:hypothetical protein